MANRGMAIKLSGGEYFELTEDRNDRSCNGCAFYKLEICTVGYLNLGLICSTWDDPHRMKFKKVVP